MRAGALSDVVYNVRLGPPVADVKRQTTVRARETSDRASSKPVLARFFCAVDFMTVVGDICLYKWFKQ